MNSLRASLTPIPARRVFKEASPVALGYVPIAIFFGTLANHAGLSIWQTAAMSLFIYSGAGQLVTVQMLAAGAQPLAIAVAAGVLTVRHVLMGASLSPYTHMLPAGAKALLSPMMTDESFALAWKSYSDGGEPGRSDHGFFLGVNLYLYLAWNVATLAGFAAGDLLPDLATHLEWLFTLLFVAILTGLVKTAREAAVVGFSLALSALIWGRLSIAWSVPVVGLAAALAGIALERYGKGGALGDADPHGAA